MPTQPTHHTPLPTPPSTNDSANFDARADAFLGAMETFGDQMDALADNAYDNAVEGAASATLAAASETAAAANAELAEVARIGAEAAQAAAEDAATLASGLTTTSSSSVTVGTGAKTWTIPSGRQFQAGQPVIASVAGDEDTWLYGRVTSYSSTTLIVDVTDINGSGAHASWNISLSGIEGPPGSPVTFASEAEALAGVVADKVISPAVFKPALYALQGWRKHGSTVTISSPIASVDFEAIPSPREILVVARSLSHNGGGGTTQDSFAITTQTGGNTWGTKRAVTASGNSSGSKSFMVIIPLADQSSSQLGYFPVASTDGVVAPVFGLSGPVTGVRVSPSNNLIMLDGGQVELWYR